MEDAERGRIRMTLLRPIAWLMLLGAEVGAQIPVQLPELGLVGPACVTAVAACPPIESGPPGTAVVTGTFVTERAPLIDLYIVGLDRPIGVTPSHPFYSEDRAEWVGAAKLRPGERLAAADGVATVDRVAQSDAAGTVYNIETHRSHTYYVGRNGIWTHNPCSPDAIDRARGYKSGMGDPKDWKFIRYKSGSGAKSHDGMYRKMYEFWRDAYGTQREVHYFLRPDGSVFDVKIIK